MAGKLDEISERLGGLRATTESLDKTFAAHCKDDDKRHDDNIGEMRRMREEIAETNRKLDRSMTKLTEMLAPISAWVTDTKPVIESLKASRWRMVGALGLASFVIGMVGWALEAAVAYAIRWMLGQH